MGGGGRGAEGRLQASLMVLMGEKRWGRGVTTGGRVVREAGGDFKVSEVGGRVWEGEVRNVQGLAACEESHTCSRYTPS